MEKLVKESEYFIAWLLFWLSSIVGGFLLGAIMGFIVGMFLGMAGVDIDKIKVICGIVGFIVCIPLSYILFRLFVGQMIVKKAQSRALELTQELLKKSLETTT